MNVHGPVVVLLLLLLLLAYAMLTLHVDSVQCKMVVWAHLMALLAECLDIDLLVHVAVLQLQQSSLMLIIHHPPACHEVGMLKVTWLV